MIQQPPNANGIMELSKVDRSVVKTRLEAIKANFIATDDQPACDTFYVVSKYNEQNKGNEINGDTAEFIFN